MSPPSSSSVASSEGVAALGWRIVVEEDALRVDQDPEDVFGGGEGGLVRSLSDSDSVLEADWPRTGIGTSSCVQIISSVS